MTQVSINEKMIDQSYSDKIKVNELLGHIFSKYISDENQTVLGIKIDDNYVYNKDDMFESEIGNFKRINFDIGSKGIMLKNIVDRCDEHILKTAEAIKQLVEVYNRQEFQIADEKFLNIIDSIYLFIDTIYTIDKMCEKKINDNEKICILFKELEIELLKILRSLLLSKKNAETELLTQILGKELVDNLFRWKNELIPEIKKMYS